MSHAITETSVVVTGASKGIGKGIAQAFCQRGARVAIVGRHRDSAEAAVRELRAAGGQVISVIADVADPDSMNAMAEQVAREFGGIDVLCANAGIFPDATLEDMTVEDWDEVMNTNLKGTFLSVKACLPHLKKSPCGRIVLTSSITGPITGFPGWTHYAASKAGQLGFMRTAAIELARHGITVNAILPGNIITEGLEMLGDQYLKKMAAAVPMGRLGTVADIGHAAVFLASPQAGYITGQTLVIDGGQTLPESNDALPQT